MSVEQCPVERALQLVAGKWKVLILYHLAEQVRCASRPLRRALDGVSEKVLTEQLRQLEVCGMVTRTAFEKLPLRVEYSLTARGESFREPLAAICEWGERCLTDSAVEHLPVGK